MHIYTMTYRDRLLLGETNGHAGPIGRQKDCTSPGGSRGTVQPPKLPTLSTRIERMPTNNPVTYQIKITLNTLKMTSWEVTLNIGVVTAKISYCFSAILKMFLEPGSRSEVKAVRSRELYATVSRKKYKSDFPALLGTGSSWELELLKLGLGA